jgi:hypothetical protein
MDPVREAADEAAEAIVAESIDAVICVSCGHALGGDPDEDPTGDAGLPICGECARSRDFFVLDIADGELDDQIGD